MNTPRALIALSALFLAAPLAACGGSSGGSSGPPPVEGTYVLDIERTPPVSVGGGEAPRQLDSARKTALASEFSSTAYRVEVRPDATFRTSIALTEEPLTFAGTWSRTADGLHFVTTTVNGEAPPEEMGVDEDVGVEPGALVFRDGDQVVYLKKL